MRALLKYILRKYLKHITLIISIGLITIVASLGFVVLSKRLIDAAVSSHFNDFYFYVILAVITILIQIIFSLISSYIVNCTSIAMGNRLRENIYSHVLYTKWTGVKRIHSADVINRLIRDVDDIVNLFINSLPKVILAIVQFIVTVIALYYLNPILALLVAFGTPIIAILGKFYFSKMKKLTDEIKAVDSNITEHIQETLTNHTVVKAFERQQSEISKLSIFQNRIYSLIRRRTIFSIYNNGMFHLAFNGGYIGTFIWGGILLMKKVITFGTFTAYIQLVLRIQRPIQDLISVLPSLVYAKSSVGRLSKLLDMEKENQNKDIIKANNISLNVNNMSFKYEDGVDYIYHDYSLNLESGDIVAFMGPTGSGKTTLIRLLLGLLHPVSGNITISDDKNSYIVGENTRNNFVYVPQGSSLFSGSIRDNLLIGNINASEEMMKKALKIAAAEFVFSLPSGLDYKVRERYSSISEGQAQRIAIARSLLRPGKILLLDEATSALDQDTERIIFNNLKNNYRDKIIIFITHHKKISQLCDKVITL